MPGLLNPLVPLRGQQAPGRSVVNRPIRRMGLSPMSATTFTGCFGVIKTVGHAPDLMECGGKRSATPLWLVFVQYASQGEPLKPKRRRASLAAALHIA